MMELRGDWVDRAPTIGIRALFRIAKFLTSPTERAVEEPPSRCSKHQFRQMQRKLPLRALSRFSERDTHTFAPNSARLRYERKSLSEAAEPH